MAFMVTWEKFDELRDIPVGFLWKQLNRTAAE